MLTIKKIILFSIFLPTIFSFDCNSQSEDYIDVGETEFSLSLGFGSFNFPLAEQETTKFNLLPQLTWYGKKAFFDNGLFGYGLAESENEQWDLVLYPNEDGIYFNAANRSGSILIGNLFNPDHISIIKKPKRKISWMTGFAYSTNIKSFYLNTKLAFDVSDRHNGWELGFTLGNNAIYQSGKLSLGVEVGTLLKSKKIVDYYYMPRFGEISPSEGDQYLFEQSEWRTVGPFEAHSGFITHSKIKINYQLSQELSLVAFYSHFWLSNELTNTPLISASEFSALFTGLRYQF